MTVENCNINPTQALQPPRLPHPFDTITEVAEAGAVQVGMLTGADRSHRLSERDREVAMHDLERKFRMIEAEVRRLNELEIHEALTAAGGAL